MMRLCVLAMLALAASVRPALSCSCMASGPACQAYWKTDAVFDATVVDVQTEIRPVPSSFLSDSVVVLQVGQSWKGASVGRLEVTTSAYESACGYPFRKGVRYLVFARTGLDGIQPYGFESASAYSDNDGYFTVGGLAPGRYVVGINLNDLPGDSNPYARTMYPDAANPDVLTLSLDQSIDLGTWRLPPPLEVVTLPGVVTWNDGTPAGGVTVSLQDRTANTTGVARGAGFATAGPDGRFVMQVRRTRTYVFLVRDPHAPRAGSLPISAPSITIGSATPELMRIVIQQGPPQ